MSIMTTLEARRRTHDRVLCIAVVVRHEVQRLVACSSLRYLKVDVDLDAPQFADQPRASILQHDDPMTCTFARDLGPFTRCLLRDMLRHRRSYCVVINYPSVVRRDQQRDYIFSGRATSNDLS